MCGRYAAGSSPDALVVEFEVDLDRTDEVPRSILKSPQEPPPGAPDYNMAPSKQAPVVLTRALRESDEAYADAGPDPLRQLRLLTWGLVPSWAKDPSIGVRMINARAETVLGGGAFARAARSRRCLVPASGWYEWQASPTATDATGRPRRQPFFVHRADGRTCAFAGLYEFWRDPRVAGGDDPLAWLTTFTIITTGAEAGLDRIHDRQPLVLEEDDWDRWLDPAMSDPDEVGALLAVARAGRFEAYPVSRAVSSTRNNGRRLLDRALPDELVGVVDPMTGEVIGDGR